MSLADYISNPKIRRIKVDFPSACNARCIGCYTHATEKDPKRRLPLEKVRGILDDAREIGVKQMVIAADGEPLLDLDYFTGIVEYATSQGIETIVYTNGSLITQELASRFYELDVSLFVKRNSMDHNRQNALLRSDLSEKMMQGLQYLINVGFDSERLAVESYVSKENVRDLEGVLRFCRKNNIIPYFEEFISVNQTSEVKGQMILSGEELLEAFRRYQAIDREFGIETEIFEGSRRYGIEGCSLKKLASIGTDGNVKRCVLGDSYGNVYEEDFADIFERIPFECSGCSNTVIKE